MPIQPLPPVGGIAAVIDSFIPPTDNDSVYKDLPSDAPYVEALVMNRYEGDEHAYMLGVAKADGFNGQSAAFVQLCAPTILWIADWTVARWGLRPNIPDPDQTLNNWVLLDKHYEPADLKVAANGQTPLYRISGTYVYGQKTPAANVIDNIAFGLSPEFEDVFARTIGSDYYDAAMLTPSTGSSGGNNDNGQGIVDLQNQM